ncbi:MAG: helix-hairpin-helix domain-containing protein [Pirellulales bacterium]|nr:helix-hairpin-helix domain-containing protein [Pirellulales bacterium]
MKNPKRDTVARLDALPNVGKVIARDLEQIGIDHPRKLVGQNPFDLYDKLCEAKGARIDHCVIDLFMSAVDFMEGGQPKPWWEFTDARKRILNDRDNAS